MKDSHTTTSSTSDRVQDEVPPKNQTRRPTTFDVLTGVNTVVDPMWSNPSVQAAMQVLEQLADLGKTLPFVAPAFIILKVIIEIENKAREADVKCTDLLERITFMLAHLPILKTVKVTEATRQIIDRMNSIMKNAAALIEAYRKQGKVARRLTLSNKEKFSSCAQSIVTCSNDLMMSLQIHQTTQLDNILTRAPPSDPEDEAAQAFIAKHGGVEVVKENQQLVTQFADQLHISMDDKVMEQLHVNLAEVIHQNQVQLERTINQNVSSAILSGLKDLAAQVTEAEKEQKFICVQCNQEYRESINGPTSCSFHRAEMSNGNYPCCSTQNPCQFRSHRNSHHCEYPYSNFFGRVWKIVNYVDTVENWDTVVDKNLEKPEEQKASVGRLLRWVSRGERIDEPTILIRVGTVWWTNAYFFDTFTAKELQSLSKVLRITHQMTIFRTSSSQTEFSMAEWVLSADGNITGVRLTVKAATSQSPYIHVVPFDINTCTKTGEVQKLSRGGIQAYTPIGTYVIPKTVRVGPELNDTPPRAPRTDFKTVSTNLPVILKTSSEPPLKANVTARRDADFFEGVISIFNKTLTSGGEPITISSASASFRLVGDENYKPVTQLQLLGHQLPVTVDPRQTYNLAFRAQIPRSEDDIQLDVQWWNRAFIARDRPIRLKMTVESIEGEQASIVLEYVFSPFPLNKPQPERDELAFLFFDRYETWDRCYIRITKASSKDGVITIDGNEIKVERLQRCVYKALKTGQGEVELLHSERLGGVWGWKAWALVDLNCQRVYAFKFLLTQGKAVKQKKYACMGYVACPDYGEISQETRVIQPAEETVKMPELEPYSTKEYPTDDALDDYIPEPPKPVVTPSPAAATSSGSSALPADVVTHLATIDSNLSRIAISLEKLVELLTLNSGGGGHTR